MQGNSVKLTTSLEALPIILKKTLVYSVGSLVAGLLACNLYVKNALQLVASIRIGCNYYVICLVD